MLINKLIPSAILLTSLVYLIGCTDTNSDSISQSPTVTTNPNVNQTDTPATNAQKASEPPNPSTPSPAKLATGTHCYIAKTKTLDAQAKINISPTNKVDGTVQATIQNPDEGYYSSYNQTLIGQLKGEQVNLNIVTQIENDTQKQQATWTITESYLKTDRETFVKEDCGKLSSNPDSQAGTVAAFTADVVQLRAATN